MKSTAGIIFSNIHDSELPELTRLRTIGSVPIAARYRLIDFPLSSMANAGINDIGIICKTKYHSLLVHVGAGKPWDLARKNGGVSIISPFVDPGGGVLYTNRLEALQNSLAFVNRLKSNYVVLSDSDLLTNIDYADIINAHEETGADITAVYKRMRFPETRNFYNVELIVDKKTGIVKSSAVHQELKGTMNHGLNIYVINRSTLMEMIERSMVFGYRSFSRELFPAFLKRVKVMAYEFKGFVRDVVSLDQYWQANMDLLDNDIRDEIFNRPNLPIFTPTNDSDPTVYSETAKISNSLISDGCEIAGTVENSIISRGVRIDEKVVVRNSVIQSDCIIESGASLNYIVTDKGAVIRKGKEIAGAKGLPYFIPANTVI